MAEQRPESPLWQGTRLVIGLSHRASRAVAQAAGHEPGAGLDRGAALAAGAAAVAVEAAVDAAEIALGVAAVVGRGLRPLSWTMRQPARAIGRVRERGQVELARADEEVDRLLDALLPRLVEAVLERLDLTELVRSHVDLDALVEQVDLDTIISRVDLDAVVSRVDLDRIAARLDIDAVAARLDLNRVAARLDLDSIVRRLDLDAIISRVDLDAIVSRVDVDAIVARLDLVGLAETVIEGVDLAEVIRSSSGSVASEAVRDVRIQSIEADQAVAGFVDRLIGRHARQREALPAPRQPGDEGGTTTEQPAPASIEAPGARTTPEDGGSGPR